MLNMDFVSDLGAGLAALGQHEEALTLVVNALDVQKRGGKLAVRARLVQGERPHPGVQVGRGLSRSRNKPAVGDRLGETPVRHPVRIEGGDGSCRAIAETAVACQRPTNISARLLIECPAGIVSPDHKRALQIVDRMRSGIKAARLGRASSTDRAVAQSSSSPRIPIQAQVRQSGACCGKDVHSRALNAMGKLVADIIVETLQSAGVKHCYGVGG